MSSSRDVAVGALVGVTDIASVYPLAVLACRREAGMSMRQALAAGRFWSGAATQSILIPYSIMVEGGTAAVNRALGSYSQHPLLGPLVISGIVGVGLQPIEKQLVVDQLLQSSKNDMAKSTVESTKNSIKTTAAKTSTNPVRAMVEYQREFGLRALYKGISFVVLREFIYIASITVINPYAVAYSKRIVGEEKGYKRSAEALAAFSVGFSAGMVSAPVQTINAMMKDERNHSRSLAEIVKRDLIFEASEGGFMATVRRLYFGSLIRSLRCAGAGVLYHTWRTVLAMADEE